MVDLGRMMISPTMPWLLSTTVLNRVRILCWSNFCEIWLSGLRNPHPTGLGSRKGRRVRLKDVGNCSLETNIRDRQNSKAVLQ